MDTEQKQLTAEDIDRMEAGPELDALVAERVMEWVQDYAHAEWDANETIAVPEGEAWFRLSADALEYVRHNPGNWVQLDASREGEKMCMVRDWHPSTDIAAAWRVVEKFPTYELKFDHYYQQHLCILSTYTPAQWDAWTGDGPMGGRQMPVSGSWGDTPMLAICRAALKAALPR